MSVVTGGCLCGLLMIVAARVVPLEYRSVDLELVGGRSSKCYDNAKRMLDNTGHDLRLGTEIGRAHV